MNDDNLKQISNLIASLGANSMISYSLPKTLFDSPDFLKSINAPIERLNNSFVVNNDNINRLAQSMLMPMNAEFAGFSKLDEAFKSINSTYSNLYNNLGLTLYDTSSKNAAILSNILGLKGLETIQSFYNQENVFNNLLKSFSNIMQNPSFLENLNNDLFSDFEEISFDELQDLVEGTHDETKEYDNLDIPNFISRCEKISFDDDINSLVEVNDLLNDLNKTTNNTAKEVFWNNFSKALATKLGERTGDIIYLVILLVIYYYFQKYEIIQKMMELLSSIS